MDKRKEESGDARQRRLRREQDRPEQNRGYDEAAHGGVADERPHSVPATNDLDRLTAHETVDDREARLARDEVRRRDRSANRPGSREP